MNTNTIRTDGWSNAETQRICEAGWPNSPELQLQHENGYQCGGCAFFAKFNADWGLCCNSESAQHLETVFEHYTCRSYVHEGWGPHSFSTNDDFKCRCGGMTSAEWEVVEKTLKRAEQQF